MPRPDIDGRLSGVRGAAVSECGLNIVASALLAITRLPLYTPSASCRRSHFARSATLELAPPAGARAAPPAGGVAVWGGVDLPLPVVTDPDVPKCTPGRARVISKARARRRHPE